MTASSKAHTINNRRFRNSLGRKKSLKVSKNSSQTRQKSKKTVPIKQPEQDGDYIAKLKKAYVYSSGTATVPRDKTGKTSKRMS